MGDVLEFNQKLETTTCCSCGVVFAIPVSLLSRLQDTGIGFFCPNGHTLFFPAGLEKQKAAQREGKRKLIELFTGDRS